MRIKNETTLALTREEAYAMICPGEDGCSDFLMDVCELHCMDKELGTDKLFDWDMLVDNAIPEWYGQFELRFDSNEAMLRNLAYIEGQPIWYALFSPTPKRLATRYGDIIQECREYIGTVALSSNEYGMPRPGVLDLWYTDITVHSIPSCRLRPRVIAVCQPFNKLIIEYIEICPVEKLSYMFVDINELSSMELIELCDQIQEQSINQNKVYRVGMFDTVEQFLELMKKNRQEIKPGEKAIRICHRFKLFKDSEILLNSQMAKINDNVWMCKPELVEVVKVERDSISYKTKTDEGIEYMEGDVPYNLLPFSKELWKEVMNKYNYYSKREAEKYK